MACEYIPKSERERLSYVWSGDNNEWTEKAELKFNATEYLFKKKEDDESRSWRKSEDYFIYRDLTKKGTFDVMTVLSKQYVIQDTLVCQSWKIKNDMREIAEHICMNASYYDSIREKEIIAWFALDLPFPIGPDKYCGLPGLILEINEANGAVVYTATSVLLSHEKLEIEKPVVKKKRKVISFQEYNNIVSKYISECKKMQRPYFWGISF